MVTGIILFSIAVYYLGSKQNLFTSSVTVKSYFSDVNGLMEGNKVQYSGITVGFVSHIEIVEDTTILVEMSVDKNIRQFIRKDSKVEITTDGLMGSKIVSIHPGTSGSQNIGEDDFLPTQQSISLQDVLTEAKKMMEEGQMATKNLLEITQKINNGEGDLAVLLNENKISTTFNQAGNELLEITSNTNEIIEKINQGEGDLGRLINDTIVTGEAKQVMQNLTRISGKTDLISGELLDFSKALNEENGLIHRLVYDTTLAANIDTTIIKVNYGVDNLVNAAETVERSWLFNLFSKNK